MRTEFTVWLLDLAVAVEGNDGKLMNELAECFGMVAEKCYLPQARVFVSEEPPPAFERSAAIRFARGDGWFFALNSARLEGYAFFEKGRELDAWQRATPLRLMMSWLADARGDMALVHAAAVSHDERAALIAGPSGSGKSTIAAHAVARGGGFLGDDWVGVLRSGYACPVYRSIKIADPIPIVGVRTRIDHPKKIVRLVDTEQHAVNIVAVIVPVIDLSNDGVRLTRILPAEALRRIAPSTLLQTPGLSDRPMNVLKTVLRNVTELFELRVGSGRQGMAAAIVLEMLR